MRGRTKSCGVTDASPALSGNQLVRFGSSRSATRLLGKTQARFCSFHAAVVAMERSPLKDASLKDAREQIMAAPPQSSTSPGPNRRTLLGGVTGLGAALAAPPLGEAASVPSSSGTAEMHLNINGRERVLNADVRTSLLDALREHLDLTGSKKGCDQGQCGACTVHIDGRRELACLTLAVAAQGRRITTIEGLANSNSGLHPMQQAFIDHDGFQCGYCTPGQIMSAVACVQEGHANTDTDIQEYMSGNLCRCAAYPKIVAAIKQARGQMERG